MKIYEIREHTTEELRGRSRELKQEILHLRIQKATGQLESKSAIRARRKENARILTVLHERALGIRQSGAEGKDAATAAPVAPEKKAPARKSPAKKPAAKKAVKKAS